LMTMVHGLLAAGTWREGRGSNLLDGGAPFARAYRTLDDQYVAIAPFEARFFESLLKALALDDIDPSDQYQPSKWGEIQRRFEAVFKTRTRDEWCDLLEGTDACLSPILGIHECMEHPHNRARETFIDLDGIKQPAPTPRFSRTPSEIRSAAGPAEPDLKRVLSEWGASPKILDKL